MLQMKITRIRTHHLKHKETFDVFRREIIEEAKYVLDYIRKDDIDVIPEMAALIVEMIKVSYEFFDSFYFSQII